MPNIKPVAGLYTIHTIIEFMAKLCATTNFLEYVGLIKAAKISTGTELMGTLEIWYLIY